MRADEFISKDQKLDEIRPLLVGAAKAPGKVGTAMNVAKTVGKGIKGAAKLAGKAVDAVGSIGDTADEKNKQKEIDQAKDNLIKPGRDIELPTDKGSTQKFKVAKVSPDEVELENPDGTKSPNQPNRFVYNKQDIKQSMPLD